jgi:hypothetical protein
MNHTTHEPRYGHGCKQCAHHSTGQWKSKRLGCLDEPPALEHGFTTVTITTKQKELLFFLYINPYKFHGCLKKK